MSHSQRVTSSTCLCHTSRIGPKVNKSSLGQQYCCSSALLLQSPSLGGVCVEAKGAEALTLLSLFNRKLSSLLVCLSG